MGEKQLNSMSLAFNWSEQSDGERKVQGRESLDRQNEFLITLNDLLGETKSRLIDMSQWKDDVVILNDVVEWLGFDRCSFKSLVHENHDRYKRDETTQVGLGEECSYPHF